MHLLLYTQDAQMLKIPDMTKVLQAKILRPHLSKSKISNISAGNSVTVATLKVTKTSSPRLSTFRT